MKNYCTSDAKFSGQCGFFHPPLASAPNLGGTLENYVNWMKMTAKDLMPGCYLTDVSQAYDSDSNTALFAGVFHGTHSKTPNGSNLPSPTMKYVATDCSYKIEINEEGKISSMVKVWNSEWLQRELGWIN